VHKKLQSPKKTVNHRVAGSSPAWGEPAKSSTFSDYLRHLFAIIQKNAFSSGFSFAS
jgi:hypothetical protein